jgi:hypothetical protein
MLDSATARGMTGFLIVALCEPDNTGVEASDPVARDCKENEQQVGLRGVHRLDGKGVDQKFEHRGGDEGRQ